MHAPRVRRGLQDAGRPSSKAAGADEPPPQPTIAQTTTTPRERMRCIPYMFPAAIFVNFA